MRLGAITFLHFGDLSDFLNSLNLLSFFPFIQNPILFIVDFTFEQMITDHKHDRIITGRERLI